MHAFPAFFPLSGRTVAIVGEGEAAEAKARLFEGSPADIRRIAADEGAARVEAYDGCVLVFVCVADDGLAARAAAAARAAGAPVNVVDRPALSDFFTPAVIDRGEVVAAVGTSGTAPILASLLRSDIEARVPKGAGRLAALLGRMQAEVRAAFPEQARRRAFLRAALSSPAADAAMAGEMEEAEDLLRASLTTDAPPIGQVRYIDGRGPAEALSLAAARALAEADVLAADDDADPEVVRLARRDARRLASGVDALALAALADEGLQVARITGAVDPAEEMAALTEAGVRAFRL
ncbi:MAG TPA: bifunctional precorrin-2 dehydrogenase/sirohydrochlorin ferrochelatase [Caulobacteraceae bacterium]|nr:bifunctional precorrin-2 dehydrogenase/sirohydrochlorin ferrochelatase [Caulobacteraceae bacterium]